MPELPEVETVKRELQANNLIGKKILKVEVFWKKSVEPENLATLIMNKRIKDIGRRGKYLFFILSNDHYLFFHLRMSGRVFLTSSLKTHDRVIITLSGNMKVAFNDTRKFGRISYHKNPDIVFSRLGVEPLDREFSYKYLQKHLFKSRKTIKAMLLDQKVIAGMGNIYVDEALFDSEIHPEIEAGSLNDEQLKRLAKSARKVIRQGIKNKGTSLGKGKSNFFSPNDESGRNQLSLKVYGRTSKPCFACGKPIQKIKTAGRGTHFCANCQKTNL